MEIKINLTFADDTDEYDKDLVASNIAEALLHHIRGSWRGIAPEHTYTIGFTVKGAKNKFECITASEEIIEVKI